jgi:hypothetical protein
MKKRQNLVRFIKKTIWLHYINLSTVIVGLAIYYGYASGQWRQSALITLGAMVILIGLMVMIGLQAEQRLKIRKPLAPRKLFP